MIEELKKEAEALAGRELEVEQTVDKKFIVLWMQFETSPPPKGDTEEDAWRLFVDFMRKKSPEPVVTDEVPSGIE